MSRAQLPPRRCFTCGKVKPPDAYETSYKRRCLDCWEPHPCCVCGATTSPDRSTCCDPDCVLEAARRSGQRGGRNSQKKWQRTHGRRTTRICPSCAKRKALTEENWRVGARDADGNVVRWSPYCKPCCRAYYKMVYDMSPERRAQKRDEAARYRQRLRERLATDPVFAAEFRAHRAEIERQYRDRRRALRSGSAAPEQAHAGRSGPELPVGPFIEWCDRAIQRYANEETFCEAVGLHPRRLFAWRKGEATVVRFDVVDEALTKDGSAFLWDLYPDLYPEEQEVAA